MTETVFISSSTPAATDNPRKLQRIMSLIDGDEDLMFKRDGGRLQVISFQGNVLTLDMLGACVGCKKTLGTQRGIMDIIQGGYGEVTVQFKSPAAPSAATLVTLTNK